MKILGIETSCDETSAAIIETERKDSFVRLKSNVTASSLALHAETGGIVPEIAAREQIKYILPVITQALVEAGLSSKNVDAVAVTYGPGLIGSLLVGVETAKTLAYVWNKPLIPVNHLYGHIYANWIQSESEPHTLNSIPFPALALVVSGGHTDLVLLNTHGNIQWLGGTRDDAAGECFDKCARLLGYNYPGGPKISQLAEKGDQKKFKLPRPMLDSNNLEFSFSGLKTAFLRLVNEHFPITKSGPTNTNYKWRQIVLEETLKKSELPVLYDLCASLEEAIVEVLVKKTLIAIKKYKVQSLLLSGGVSANKKLKIEMQKMLQDSALSTQLHVPPPELCVDNAAMIATAAFYNDNKTPWQKITANPELYFD